jgi:hypothetical protein
VNIIKAVQAAARANGGAAAQAAPSATTAGE